MSEVKERMRNVLDETLQYYDHPDKAGWYHHSEECVYYNKLTGNKCAVGRCLNDDAPDDVFNYNGPVPGNLWFYNHFKPQYCGLPHQFWNNLQTIHDLWAERFAGTDCSVSITEYYQTQQSASFGNDFLSKFREWIDQY